jgi:ribonuclease Z
LYSPGVVLVKKKTKIWLLVIILACVSTSIFFKNNYYFSGSEELEADEIRLTACGTGMPAANPFQASTCWLVETRDAGNFLFDLGSNSMGNVSILSIPPDKLSRLFITHLHTDHWGGLESLWAGGWVQGRTKPLEVYGPNGATPELGTAYAIKHFLKAYNWDRSSRNGRLNTIPGDIIAHEFDYKVSGQTVYEKEGAKVTSFPAVHAIDGPVAYVFEYKGLKVALTGDNFPNKFTLDNTQGVDVIVHESFLLPEFMVDKFGLPPESALEVATKIHTSPMAFGKFMNMVKPRHAIAYHFLNLPITSGDIEKGIREYYDGELSLAKDMMMWNITKSNIRERQVLWNPFNPPKPGTPLPAEPDKAIKMSSFISESKIDVTDVEADMVKNFEKKYGDTPEH